MLMSSNSFCCLQQQGGALVHLGLHPGDGDLQGGGLQLPHLHQELRRRGGAELQVSAAQPGRDQGEDRGVWPGPRLH